MPISSASKRLVGKVAKRKDSVKKSKACVPQLKDEGWYRITRVSCANNVRRA